MQYNLKIRSPFLVCGLWIPQSWFLCFRVVVLKDSSQPSHPGLSEVIKGWLTASAGNYPPTLDYEINALSTFPQPDHVY